MTTWPEVLTALVGGSDLSAEQTAWAMGEMLSGEATPVQVAGFAVALRAKGEAPDEITGLVRAMLGRFRGREVDTAGDGFFATFDGPARGVRCAQAIAGAVKDLGIEVRAGVHTGEVEMIAGKVGGIAVNIGARIAALARPSEVLVSHTVEGLVSGSGLVFVDAGEQELKGVPERWHLYRLVSGPR